MTFASTDIRLFIWTANRPVYCQQALKSLLAQKGKLDIWVLDNSNNDETKEMLASYQHIHYIKTDPKISFANFKKMQELLQTPYALTLHDDDLLHPDYLELALKVLNKYPNVSFIGTKQNQFFTSEPPAGYQQRPILSGDYWLIDNQADFALSFWDEPSPSWSGSIIKSQFYKNIDPDLIKQRYGKIFDWPLLIEIMHTGKAISFCDKNCFFYRVHANQDTICDATGVTLEQFVNWLNLFHQYALAKTPLYKIYFRRSVSNILNTWRVFVSSREKVKRTESELLQYLKHEKLLTDPMLFYHKMEARSLTKICALPLKLYCKRNYYKTMLKHL